MSHSVVEKKKKDKNEKMKKKQKKKGITSRTEGQCHPTIMESLFILKGKSRFLLSPIIVNENEED